MKTKIFKAGVSMSLIAAALTPSCSDRVAEEYSPLKEQVPLEIGVAGISPTRSVITGTTVPDTCIFAVFHNSPNPTPVIYRDGKWNVNDPIYISEDTPESPVYAFYPDNAYLTEIAVDTRERIDYLRGISVDASGTPTDVGFKNHRASLMFEHILARITVNIHKDANVEKEYKFETFNLGGSNENSYRYAVYNAETDSFVHYFEEVTDDIPGELKDGKYWLSTPEDMVSVDFLVIPTQTAWQLQVKDFSADWHTLPTIKYEPGKQYIFDCLIKEADKAYLTITQCDIRPWVNKDMPEVEGY